MDSPALFAKRGGGLPHTYQTYRQLRVATGLIRLAGPLRENGKSGREADYFVVLAHREVVAHNMTSGARSAEAHDGA